MTQYNNEAASALHSAIMNLPCDESQAHGDPQTAYKYGHRDARHAAAELVSEAASASQSSTAGAAKGGITNEEFRKTLLDLLFGHKHGGLDNTEAILAHVARQESGAVAEGVDTELPPLPPPALKHVPVGKGLVRNGYSASQMREYATTYGAQQREAGRREVVEGVKEFARFQLDALSAAPPAKAEGMSDTERLDFIEANTNLQIKFHKRRWSLVGFTNYEYEVHKTAREAIDAAILAQQAKKGNQQ